MKTTVYTYRNKQVALFQVPSFYLVKNKAQLDKIIDDLMKIDAVGSPHDDKLTYPCVLKMVPGFGPNLVVSTKAEYQKALAEEQKTLEIASKKLEEWT